jgi:pimeloyl-ACP methyl ester carboxylesterase
LLLPALVGHLAFAAWAAQPPGGDPVTFPNPRGVILRGELFGQGRTAIVLAHGDGADQRSWVSFARTLAARGWLALTFDFEGYGRSDGTRDPRRMDGDLAAATSFLRGYGAERIFLVGAGVGGTAALRLAARERVAGLAVLSAPLAARGLSAEGEIGRISAPRMLVAAEGDAEGARAARALGARAKPGAVVLIVPGQRRGAELLSAPAGTDLTASLLAFFSNPTAGGR